VKGLTTKEKVELSHRDYYKKGDELYVKVVNFPLSEVREYQGAKVGQESMWVKVTEGDIYKGVGVVMNTPHFDNCAATLGDLISYSDGNSPFKRPHFVKLIERAEE
jgi:hypothetical protein